jgi:hypothetical protein
MRLVAGHLPDLRADVIADVLHSLGERHVGREVVVAVPHRPIPPDRDALPTGKVGQRVGVKRRFERRLVALALGVLVEPLREAAERDVCARYELAEGDSVRSEGRPELLGEFLEGSR